MVGRDEELSRLLRAVERARGDEVNLVLVAGEAGIGKSRLVEEMVSRLDDAAVVLVGHGVELKSGELPFGVVTETLRSLVFHGGPTFVKDLLGEDGAIALAPLVPELGIHTGDDWVAMMSACLRLFENLAREHLVCWIIEDLQWADAPTRDIVGLLCRTVPVGRLLVVCTVRVSDPLGNSMAAAGVEPWLRDLARLPNAELVLLGRLERTSVRALVNGIVDGPLSRGAVERIVELSDGVPYLVEELAGGGHAGPFTVEALAGTRLEHLSPNGRRLVEAAAMGEGYLDAPLVEAVLDLEPHQFDAALRDAVDAGLLDESSLHAPLRFRHALIRHAVDDGISPGLRRSWHARWANVLHTKLGRSGAAPVTFAVAHHRFHAGDAELAFDSLVEAAKLAHRTGVASEEHTLLMRLLVLWTSVRDPAHRAEASHRDVLYEAIWAGTWSEGPTAAAEAIELALLDGTHDPVERAWLQLRLAAGRNKSAALERAELSEREIDTYAEIFSATPTDRMMVDGLLMLIDLAPIESDVWEQLAERAARQAREVGDEILELESRAHASHRLRLQGRPDAAVDLMGKELAKSWQVRPHQLSWFDGNLIWNLAVQGRYTDADRAARRALARVKDPRPVAAVWEQVVENAVWVWRAMGLWDEAASLLASSRSCWDDELHMVDVHADVLQLLRAGRVTRAAAWRALLEVDDQRRLPESVLLEHCALLAAAEGDLDRARNSYRKLWDVPDPEMDTDLLFTSVLQAVRMEADARSSALAGAVGVQQAARDGEAERHISRILGIASKLHTFGDLGLAWRAEVAAQSSRFHGEETLGLFEDAVAAWEAVGQPYDAALCHVRLAESYLNCADRTAAAGQLEAVRETAILLGAQPLLAQADALADRAGIRRPGGPGGPTRLLTTREHEVLVLLADGRSNKQIAAGLYLSPKTASVHVSRIMAKLGATNRTEAVAIARREGLIDL